jgi:DNA-binding CsgD family transcriptional regulator
MLPFKALAGKVGDAATIIVDGVAGRQTETVKQAALPSLWSKNVYPAPESGFTSRRPRRRPQFCVARAMRQRDREIPDERLCVTDVQRPYQVIGRADELAAVDRLLARAARACAALVFEGEAGIGKTALWGVGRAVAQERGFRVLSSRPARSETQLPLGVFGDLFSGVSADLLEKLPGPQRRALEVALLRADPEDVAADQRALSVATLSLLRELAADAPLLLAVDDVQWLDQSSAGILAFALGRLRGSPVGILLTQRAGAEPHPLDLEAALLGDAPERRTLGPLSVAALHRLFGARLGHSFPRLILIKIEKMSGGNPFYALEIGRALERRSTDVTAGEPLPVPDSVAALTRERIRALPETTRHALLLAATAPVPTLETLADAGVVEPARALEPAVRESIVALERGYVRFAHPLLAQAALASVDVDALRELHLALARNARSEDARAHHLGAAASGHDEVAAAALEGAAVRARARGASLDAVSLYERASRLTPDPDRAVVRAIGAAEGAHSDLSDPQYADAILARALERAQPGPARAEAMSLRAIVWYYHGRQAEATRLCEEALAEAAGDDVVRAKVLLRVAYLHGQLDLERTEAELKEAAVLLERAHGPIEPELLASALLDRAVFSLQMAEGSRSEDVERGTLLHAAVGRSWEWERCEGTLYELALHTDDLDTARARMSNEIERLADRGAEDPFRFVHMALLDSRLGDWHAARAWAERALEAYEREGADLHPAFALRGLALVDALEGRVDEARQLSCRGLELATERGDLVVALLHRQILGFVALSTGDVDEADRQLSAAGELDAQLGARHPLRTRLDGDRVEAALAVGDVERARQVVERLERVGSAAPTPWTLAIGARCRGLLEAARGDLDAAAAALERAVEKHERLPMPFERARTLLAKGQVHHRRKEKKLADATLREALRIFDELGSPLWAERTQAELARVGLRRREPDELSETERRVAEFAAEGLSNQEIAQRAFLSVKTVEANLTRVYRKLGIRSRAALARKLA